MSYPQNKLTPLLYQFQDWSICWSKIEINRLQRHRYFTDISNSTDLSDQK